MKYVLWAVLIVCIVLGGGAAYLYSLLDMQELRTHIAEISKASTGKTLLLDQAPALSFMPLGLRLGRATWGFENGQPAKHGMSASINGGTASIALLPLLQGIVAIEVLNIDQPHLTIKPEVVHPKTEKTTTRPAGAQLAQSPLAALHTVNILSLHIENGTVQHTLSNGNTTQAEAIMLDVGNVALNKEATWKLKSIVQSQGIQAQLVAQGFFTPSVEGIALRAVQSSLTPQTGLHDFGELAFTLDGQLALPAGKKPSLVCTIREGSAQWRTLSLKWSTSLTAKNNIYTLSPLQIQLQTGGEATAQLSVNMNKAQYTATVSAKNIILHPVCTAFDKRLNIQGIGEGTFDGGSMGLEEKSLRRNLNGKGAFTLHDIVVGHDMLPSQLFGARIPNRFDSLHSPFVITSGVLNAKPIMLKATGLEGKGQALIDLPKEYCRAHGTLEWSGLAIPLQAIGPFGAITIRVDPNFSRHLLKQGLQGLF
jgi:uncharacterized protein involved in outer membrane biogenesis